jgi:hypothetical protein
MESGISPVEFPLIYGGIIGRAGLLTPIVSTIFE